MQLHAGDALEVGGHQIDAKGPYTKGQFGAVHDGIGLDGEIETATETAEGCGFTGRRGLTSNDPHRGQATPLGHCASMNSLSTAASSENSLTASARVRPVL